jgi:sorbitol/mannitol transport system permease protein
MQTPPPPSDTAAPAPEIVRRAQHVSRAEGWRKRGPLLPALIFMIVVTQIPFVFTLYFRRTR